MQSIVHVIIYSFYWNVFTISSFVFFGKKKSVLKTLFGRILVVRNAYLFYEEFFLVIMLFSSFKPLQTLVLCPHPSKFFSLSVVHVVFPFYFELMRTGFSCVALGALVECECENCIFLA